MTRRAAPQFEALPIFFISDAELGRSSNRTNYMKIKPQPPDCGRCNGTGVIVLKLLRGGWGGTRYLCGGTAPDDARGVIEDDCDVCGGVGHIVVEEEEEKEI